MDNYVDWVVWNLSKKIDYNSYIGNTYEDRFGNLWFVKDIIRKDFSNKKKNNMFMYK